MSFPEDLAQKAERSLAKLRVQVKTDAMVKNVDREGVTIVVGNNIDRLTTKTVIWAGGVTVTPLARTLAKRTGAETDREEGSRSAPTSQSPIIRISMSSEIWHSLWTGMESRWRALRRLRCNKARMPRRRL
jgi:NADH dehydrogenase FAD-containing subunit